MSAVTEPVTEPGQKLRNLPHQPLHAVQLAEALLRLRTVEAVTGLGRSTIYAKLKAGDGAFPQPVRLGARCTRWRAADIQAWLAAQGQ